MRVLITGGGGFLAAWIIQRLHRAGMQIRVLDTHTDRTRVRDIAGPEAADALEWVVADIADTTAVVNAAQGCDRILHLAGVLTPTCRENPVLGARINVLGTLNVFEAARVHGMGRVIYTSSGGIYGPEDGQGPFPITHYGAYKLANEGNARAYWEDARIASIGMRPFVVYGPGRDGGLSAGPTLACKAAAQGQPYVIPFTGQAGMVYVDDVAAAYEAALHATFEGAHTLNLTGHAVSMDEVIQTIRRIVPQADIRCEGPVIPSSASAPNEFGHGLLALGRERSLHEGIALTIAHYTPSVEAGT